MKMNKLITNLKKYPEGGNKRPKYFNRPFDDLADYWINRWMLPRSKRVTHWRDYQKSQLFDSLILPEEGHNHNGRIA